MIQFELTTLITVILRGICFVVESSILPAIIESDAKRVVNLIKLGKSSYADVGTVINDILGLIGAFPISIVFAGRNANSVTHSLAKLTFSLSEDQYLIEDYHPCVESLLFVDCNG
ncbi:hypothetical protein Ddye_010140 [Dipteronia dyeriana]|uniref:RNase H type-1 domain-containing protein n=1 Tax=Dipteronia dyeriana TaxID=168575 RepID=A0AAE0CNJ0_9ROSI|nr:hypothetical protein Ddye_010140 [Dipteronia dyeriana]